MTDEYVTIKKSEYISLQKEALWSLALDVAGVDNWAGIDYAVETYGEMLKENGLDDEE